MLVLILLLGVVQIRADQGSPRDTYLDAYAESHGPTANAQPIKNDREFTELYSYPPSQPSYQYGPPPGPSGPPKQTYGPPVAPVHNYGPPIPVYGPPIPVYGNPHGMLSLLDKLKFKLDFFTIGKILLKIVIFKKIVSFIAIICLLLFIPSLKKKVDEAMPDDGDDGDDSRTFGLKKYQAVDDQTLNNITKFVLEAIEDFSKNYTPSDRCEGVLCKTRISKKIDDKELARTYAPKIK